jgi:hypothetical protein
MKWIKITDDQPPKDGTRFIIHKEKYARSDRRDGYVYTLVAYYRREDEIHPDYMGNPDDCSEADLVVVARLVTAWSYKHIPEDFTHWMPLPEPPKQ